MEETPQNKASFDIVCEAQKALPLIRVFASISIAVVLVVSIFDAWTETWPALLVGLMAAFTLLWTTPIPWRKGTKFASLVIAAGVGLVFLAILMVLLG